MNRFLVMAAALLLAAAPLRATSAKDSLTLASSRRMDATVRAVLPMQFGASTVINSDAPVTPLYRNFLFSIEPFGVRWSSRGLPVDANVGTRLSFLNFGKDHAYYVGVPVRATLRFARRGRIYASAAGEYLIHGTMHNMPWRCSVESGISYGGYGIFASYGITPHFTTATGPGNTLSFGLIIGL
ncbi:MAG: hypothetical protein J5759_03585 [Bacteroidales bacterium]|nr:hypothetical protein [Bacteroidales bacterium]